MCFYFKQSQTAQELQNRYKTAFEKHALYEPAIYNGFQFPKTPIITNKNRDKIQLFEWGLIPFWAKDKSIQKLTLNARIESIHEKPSFKNITHNTCLILASSFFEWQWLDSKGKSKQKYEILLPNSQAFAFAGLWSEWQDKTTGKIYNSYTILTTEANDLMCKIHNSKKRMPIILHPQYEQQWLTHQTIASYNNNLIALPIN